MFAGVMIATPSEPSFCEPDKVARTAKSGVPIGAQAQTPDGSLTITLTARLQHYNAHPRDARDYYDQDIQSPKSVKFSPDGKKVYVNSLEGSATIAYDPASLAKISVIRHRFGPDNELLISNQPAFDYRFLAVPANGQVNWFSGKPVEMEFSHAGRYLWVSYYRRHYDENSLDPSAVAVIDALSDRIVKVLPSGPIPKYLAASPDGRWMAFIHWGDNTVGLVDISSDMEHFQLTDLIVVEKRLSLDFLKAKKGSARIDRDKECGFCLRGAIFTADSAHLLVGRLSGGGIAVINVSERRYVGTVWGMKPTPRHLALSSDGRWVYVGSNVGGYVAKFDAAELVRKAYEPDHRATPKAETFVGSGARTIALSPDGRWVYVAVNAESRLAVLRADDLTKETEISVDSFPVGLAVSPDGRWVWVTSQGRSLRGGNSVSIYEIGFPMAR